MIRIYTVPINYTIPKYVTYVRNGGNVRVIPKNWYYNGDSQYSEVAVKE